MKKLFYLMPFLFFTININAQQNALAFDGVNDYVQTNITSLTGTSGRTIEAWIKTSGTVTTQQIIVGMGTMPLGTRFTFNVLQGKLRIEIGGGGINSTKNVDDSQWHHVAVTFDNSATNKFTLYIDGAFDIAGNITAATVNTAAGVGVAIGRRNDGVNFFQGQIDEVRIWNTVRTSAEIAASYNNELCGSNPSLIGYYKFNQGTANGNNTGLTTLNDDSGNNNNGTLNSFLLTGSTSNWTSGTPLSTPNSTSSTINVAACSTYTAPSGTVITSAGTYTDIIPNAVGCDSVITINLTLNNTASAINVAACSSYTAPSGAVYSSTGTYTDIIPNAAMCDSVITVNLTIQNNTSSFSVTACDSYTSPSGQVYTSSGMISDTIMNVAGCDSVMAINLTIASVDTSVTQVEDTLTANVQGSTYQWIDCNTGMAIIDATSSSFTPTSSGDYAVVITTTEGCSDTSSCYQIIFSNTEHVLANSVKIYPNPITDGFQLDIASNLIGSQGLILNSLGQVIQAFEVNTTSQFVRLADVPSGIYYLKIVNESGLSIQKTLVIQ